MCPSDLPARRVPPSASLATDHSGLRRASSPFQAKMNVPSAPAGLPFRSRTSGGFRHEWDVDKHFVDYDAERVSPVPDKGMDSYPPYWVWDDTQEEVSIGLSVAPASSMKPGRYDFVVRVWQSRELTEEPALTATTSIEVR